MLNKKQYTEPKVIVFGTVRNLTGGSNTSASDTGTGGKNPPGQSDRRLKENIVKVDEHPAGFGLYLFDYKPEHQARLASGRQFGTMADEVAAVAPEAVSRDEYGFAVVDYAKLGIIRH